MTFDIFASTTQQVVEWVSYLLFAMLVYYGWLIVKGGSEGSTHREAWGLGKVGLDKIKSKTPWVGTEAREEKKAKKAASREKSSLLSEYIEEKKELELIGEAVSEVELFETKFIDFRNSGGTGLKAVKDSFKEMKDAIDKAAQETNRLKRATFRQERRYDQLVKALDEAGVKDDKIREVRASEAELLAEHDKVIKAIKKVYQNLGLLEPAMKKNAAGLLTVPAVPNKIAEMKRSLGEAKTAQDRAYRFSEALIASFQKYWK